MELSEQIFRAGVVGAGGAGFPTHKKLVEGVRLLVVNAAECEPLLASDRHVMRHSAGDIIRALALVQQEYAIPRVVIGTKQKYSREIAALQQAIAEQKAPIELFTTVSFYPAGDEQVLIYEITGETVPPGGIPLALGIVVINVTTALNIAGAVQNKPVLRKFVTVTGEVGEAVVADVPVGTSVADCIRAAGGAKTDRYTIIKGGPMMGPRYSMDKADSLFIGKADGGIILLAEDHPLIQFGQKPIEHMVNQAKSVCIQCSSCTEMCPRYLIGHKMRPHRVMRSLATGTGGTDLTDALLCSECGLCELFSCPMQLSPRKMNIYVKGILREEGVRDIDKNVYSEQSAPREYRRVGQQRIIDRLQLSAYPTHVDKVVVVEPLTVHIPLKHGVGRPSDAVVAVGSSVQPGDVIGKVEFADVGCMVHASIGGTVTSTDNGMVTIERKGGAG